MGRISVYIWRNWVYPTPTSPILVWPGILPIISNTKQAGIQPLFTSLENHISRQNVKSNKEVNVKIVLLIEQAHIL